MNLSEMVYAASIKVSEESEERQRKFLDWLHQNGKNVTAASAAKGFGIRVQTAREWLRNLESAYKVTSFKVGRTVWWALTASELKRKKRWTF